MAARARRCVVLRGTYDETRRAAIERTRALSAGEVVWASPDAPPDVQAVSGNALDGLLGRSVDAVVLDLHGRIDPDAIARAEGLVRAGGALLLRMPPPGTEAAARADFAVHPHAREEVGTRFARRFERLLPELDPVPIAAVAHETCGTAEQDALVTELARAFASVASSIALVIADRGRGKSAALGRAIAHACTVAPALRIALTGPTPDALAEVRRFAPSLATVSPDALVSGGMPLDVIVIDEAAQLPLALTKGIVSANPRARIALATTCRGYEGTGRGFALRFLAWARGQERPVIERTLVEPIRWASGDPLERWAFEALLLDAEPADLGGRASTPARHMVLDRARLADDERTLRQVFGLLVQAHYRTTPTDLARLLDAPNLAVHVLQEGADVVAASLVAREGDLPRATAEAMLRGERRIAGHALPDTLVSHALRVEAGALTMIRSVRIAVHPDRRRLGLARQLVEAVHATYAPDLFGTMFGGTAELVRFRQSLGYDVVRVGLSRGARSGEPAVVMVRPVSAAAHALVDVLRVSLARELETQLASMGADEGTPLDVSLRASLAHGLPPARALTPGELEDVARGYASSTQPLDVVLGSLRRFARTREHALGTLDPRGSALVRARLLDGVSWAETARRASLPSVAAAMRGMREAVRALLDAAH